jgi:DNA-binding PadR family transcriptional regulator
MDEDTKRELTALEYVVLGLMGTEPQSGYSISSTFRVGLFRWSASPGSLYPMLKRLESQGIIVGEIQVIHETRPRKMYRLTPLGESLLNEWLRAPLTNTDVSQNHDILLLKFLFAEKRLSHQELLDWLDQYAMAIDFYEKMFRLQRPLEFVEWSVHQQLIVEAMILELNMQRTWIQMARTRLQLARQREERNKD